MALRRDFDISSKNISKIRILDALFDLVSNKPFADVTVKDICETASVSRQTFYRHFESKYDVVNWFWYEMSTRYMMRVGRDMTWLDSLAYLFENVVEYLPFFAEASKVGGYESVNAFACRSRKDSLRATIVEHLGMSLTEEIEFQIDFFAEGEARIVQSLGETGGSIDVERFAALLEKCVPPSLRSLLDDAVSRQD